GRAPHGACRQGVEVQDAFLPVDHENHVREDLDDSTQRSIGVAEKLGQLVDGGHESCSVILGPLLFQVVRSDSSASILAARIPPELAGREAPNRVVGLVSWRRGWAGSRARGALVR